MRKIAVRSSEVVHTDSRSTPQSDSPGTSHISSLQFQSCLSTLWLSLAVLIAACERPFVPEATPEIEVVSPDLAGILVDAVVPLRIRATSFRPIKRVEIGGRSLAYSEQADEWLDTLRLQTGLNTFVVEAFDGNGVRGVDTLHVVYLPLSYSEEAPDLPVPRGGHTATLLAGGDLLVTGGTDRISGTAADDAYLLPRNGSAFMPLPAALIAPRVGHTATLLPDGRVLILGGALADTVRSAEDLVSTAELYDPATRQFKIIPVAGDPVRRVRHESVVYETEGETGLFVFGGLGVLADDPTPEPLASLNRYVVRNDSLIAVGSRIGLMFADPVVGPSVTRLDVFAGGGVRRYLVAGSLFFRDITVTNNFILKAEKPFGFETEPVEPFRFPRARHADTEVLPGFVAMLGGVGASSMDLPEADEVYVDTVRSFYPLPLNVRSVKRFGHTATKLSSRRILVLGGFGADGLARSESKYLVLESE